MIKGFGPVHVLACALFACGGSSPPPPQAAASQASATSASTTTSGAEQARSGGPKVESLYGKAAPEWQPELWINSPPLRLADLRGKVVLVRWWTAGCPYCSATAPALRKFDREYGSKGLVVVGMYHHKEDTPFEPSVYRDTAKRYGFTFPLAFDRDWRTLKSWMNGVDTGWTSVSFVLDKKGNVRHIHPGGQYIEGDADHAKLAATITELLGEK